MNRLTVAVVSLAAVVGTAAGVALGLRTDSEQTHRSRDALKAPGPRHGPVVSGNVGGSRADDLILIDNRADRTFAMISKGGLGPARQWAATAYGDARVVRGDFTGDGWADLALVEQDSVKVAASTGTAFADPEVWAELEVPSQSQVTAGDFNGDGHTDLAIATGEGSEYVSVQVLLAQVEQFGDQGEWRRIDNWTLANLKLATGDVDGDGDDDLIEMGIPDPDRRDVDVRVLLSQRDGFAKDTGWFVAEDWRWDESRIVIGDVDGDDSADLVVLRGTDSPTVEVALSNGAEFVRADTRTIDGLVAADQTPITQDIDGDGRSDLVLVDRVTRSARLLRSTGDGFADPGRPTGLDGVGSEPLVVGSAR